MTTNLEKLLNSNEILFNKLIENREYLPEFDEVRDALLLKDLPEESKIKLEGILESMPLGLCKCKESSGIPEGYDWCLETKVGDLLYQVCLPSNQEDKGIWDLEISMFMSLMGARMPVGTMTVRDSIEQARAGWVGLA